MSGDEVRAWVAEAEAAAKAAKDAEDAAYSAYLTAKHNYERVASVAGNRRAVRGKRTYEPFPGIGTEL